MYEYVYMTGGNYDDKNTKLLTYDEAKQMLLDAQNIKTFNPICSMRIFKEQSPFRSFIYFNFRLIVVDIDRAKQIWYEKVRGKEDYFINKIVYEKYNGQKAYIELHFRNRDFSDPNICMIRKQNEDDWEYYVADIDDTLFYRKIEFGDTETVFKDIETTFEPYLSNIQKCDKRFKRSVTYGEAGDTE